MQLGELLKKSGLIYANHGCDFALVEKLSTDSRQVQPGDLFIGMPGVQVDGSEFALAALEKGAIAALVSAASAISHPQIISLEDIVAACAQVAAAFYDFPAQAMPLVGVTGTNGKTTTTHIIEFLLRSPHYAPALFGTLYARWQGYSDTASHTTPFAFTLQAQLRQAVDAGSTIGILEVSSHALAQRRVWGCPFEVAVFTNLTQDHLDYHQDLESYFQAKALLFTTDYLKGRAIIHLDNLFGQRLVAKCQENRIPVWTFSLANPQADFYTSNLQYSSTGAIATLHTPKDEIEFKSPLVGSFNVLNVMAAIATALHLDLPLTEIMATLPQFQSVPGRVERVQASPDQDITVIVDYAHTPDSLENILKALRPFTQRELICVFGCGGDRDRTKRPIMGAIAAQLANLVYVTSDNPRTEEPGAILQDILAGIPNQLKVVVESDRHLAIQAAIHSASPGDTVIIAGKGHEDYQIIGKTKIHFDDRQEATHALQLRHP